MATKEELEKEAKEYAEKHFRLPSNALEGYLAGAEPREKKIEELENEIKELKESYYVNRCLHSSCPYLHIDNRNCTKFGGFFTSVSNKDCPMMKNLNANIKLTKAKDHIKQLLDCLKQDTNDPETNYYVCQYMDRAEQFLKEINK